jgi:NAD-reducing hydrogenase small subunit
VADIRATPFTDLKQPDESGVDVGILEGAVNNSSNEEVALRMRARCKVLVALGDCAVFGGVPALRNFFTLESALQRAYVETESTEPGSQVPTDPSCARRPPSAPCKKLSR